MEPMVYSVTMVRWITAALFCILTLAGTARAQSKDESPVHWSASLQTAPVHAGAGFEVKLEAKIDENWHIYSATQEPPPIATRFKVLSGPPFEMSGTVRQSAPKKEFDPNFGIQVELYFGTAEFWVPLKASASAAPGDYDVRIQAYYQSCDNKTCLPPRGVPVALKITVAPGTGPAERARDNASAGTMQGFQGPTGTASVPGSVSIAASTSSPAGTAAEVQQARSNGFLPFLRSALTEANWGLDLLTSPPAEGGVTTSTRNKPVSSTIFFR
ncbi:MAG: protein-disulfide reductase DsbD domain-containing protein [Acidobacteriota bacterium]